MARAIEIRSELPADYVAVEEVHRQAFGREGEAQLVAELRKLPDFDSSMSLVSSVAGEICGHILFTPLRIIRGGTLPEPVDTGPIYGLAPLAVLPQWQRRGIGAELVRAGLMACRHLGGRWVVVVGHPAYYPRFGFTSARAAGLEAPFPVSDAAFMLCDLVAAADDRATRELRGLVEYPAPFSAV